MDKNMKLYLYVFLYLIILTAMVITTTVVAHEAGHAFVGHLTGCTNIKIILYDQPNHLTYAQMSCPEDAPLAFIAFGSLLLVVPLALIVVPLRDVPLRYFSIVIIGFNFIISSSDAIEIFGNESISYFLIALGITLIVLADNILINRFLDTITARGVKQWHISSSQ